MQKDKIPFTGYEIFLIVVIAFIQFTVILDFMIISPLGAAVMRVLTISPEKFSYVVASYAISACASGIVAAGFADKFDRKKMLLFFYTGFVAGTFMCAFASDFNSLLVARIITGIFGGVIGSVSMAIVSDTFPFQQRGRVMGFVQTAFAVSQAIGLPLGLYLNGKFSWHAPFMLIAGFCIPAGIVIAIWMKPVVGHLKLKSDKNPFLHLWHTLITPTYLKAFGATVLLAAGGFMIMPFATDFLENNVGISEDQLYKIYIVTGIFGMITGPLIGKYSDKVGKFRMFIGGSVLAVIMVIINTHLGITPIWQVMILNVFMFAAITSRMIPTSALLSGVPEMKDRGAFMSLNSSINLLGGAAASILGGLIIVKQTNGKLIHYDTVGYLTVGAIVISGFTMYVVNEIIRKKISREKQMQEAAAINKEVFVSEM